MTICTHSAAEQNLLADGPHWAVKRCKDCNAFLAWMPKPDHLWTVEKIIDRLRMMILGPLFEPKEYGDGKVWDDNKFFSDMLKLNGKWSPKQEALILKRFDVYDKYGSQLKDKAPKAEATQQRSGAFSDIPF